MTDLGTQAIAIKAASIRRVYLSALCLFGLCLLWIFFSNSEESISLSSFETVINLSGRQRMLSQRIIVLATEIVAQNGIQSSQARTELQESLESFVRVQRALKLGDASLGILAFHSKESLDLYEQISPHFRKLTESVSNLLAATDRYEKERLFLEARGASHRCLPLMDRLVDLLTEEALDLSQKYHRTQNLVLFLQFLLFVLSAPFLFEPLVKRLKEIDEQQNIVLEKLRESEERFTLAVEGSDDGLWDWNVKTDDVLYSDRFVELLGYQPNNFPSRLESWANLLHPDDLGPTMEAVRKHLEEQLPYDVEYRCKSPSGDYNWFRAKGQAIWDKSGVATRMAGSLSDITDSKTKRLELESATKRLRLALEATNTGLWDWNLKTNDTYFNDSWYTMLGYQPNELPMNLDTWKELCHPEDLDRAMAEISKYMNGETSIYRCDHRLKRKDGSWMWIDDVGKIVEWDSEGIPVRMIGVHIDIRILKEKEEQLQVAKQSAEKLAKVKGEFLANMSHEIRTPMNGVLGMTELLLESELSEDQRDLAYTAHRSAENLLSVINDILDFSKIEAGKVELVPSNFKLSEFFEDLESLIRIRFEQKNLSFISSLGDDVPDEVRGDSDRLRQVLVNLVGNALKFTPLGGAVVLHVENVRESDAVTTLRFTVTDTGIGVPEDKQQKIFEAFEQADSSTTRQFGGTGLGLAISARLVALMGGEIGLHSREGTGTVFFFTADFELPIESPPQIRDRETELLSDRPLPSDLRVLIAEDNAVNQKLTRRLLEKSGCQVAIANNGQEAVEMFSREEFDLILMDIQMPVMSGEEATQIIRGTEGGKSVPIVALTAHAMSGDREKYLSLGMDGYVSKPIKKNELYKTVLKLFEERGTLDS